MPDQCSPRRVGTRILDHLLIGDAETFSFKTNGLF